MTVEAGVYESAVRGRADFRQAFRMEKARAAKLEAVLRKHHEWHLASTDPDEHGIIEAEAYAESLLCDETSAALSRNSQATSRASTS